ncbi:MAG: BamA/TamA family outer membrane protein [Candidatus Krumholzibacteria bacterium]|nr:BamA/TamA family outer membrane protein [Candidatus Krumholzibacteria bacterium]
MRGLRKNALLQVLLVVACCAIATPAKTQYFGQNKVRYDNFDFKILETEHFEIYFYPEEEQSAAEVGRMAERWYRRIAGVLDHELKNTQPLILYASHPQFEQTNAVSGLLSESTGGVTEAFKRRIVLPFGGPLSATDHVLGHELVHAFQYDIGGIGGGGGLARTGLLQLPLWFVEGMAEYLSIGPIDAHTAMWLRDASRNKKLPNISQLADPRYFPYRYGHGFLAYIAGRYGDDKIGQLLKGAVKRGDIRRTIRKVVGMDADSLAMQWHQAVHEAYDPLLESTRDAKDYGRLIIDKKRGGQYNIAPALSPDGTKLIFFSEKDLFAINLFLADAQTGRIEHTIIRAERDPHLESLQFINSGGAWDHEGKRVAFATVVQGRPALGFLDIERRKIVRKIRFEELGEILNPTWSPDGRRIAFSAVAGGFTDIFIYAIDTAELRRMTDDPFTDIQPAWSPEGEHIAFATDRFTGDLETINSGRLELAILDPASGLIEQQPAFLQGKQVNPTWSADGRSLYFLSDRSGITNVYRMDMEDGRVFQLTDLYTGVSGITALSPALSSAANADRIAFCSYEKGGYNIYTVDAADVLAGVPISQTDVATAARDRPQSPAWLPPAQRVSRDVLTAIEDPTIGLPKTTQQRVKKYRSRFSLDFIGQPTLAAGADRFGVALGGGASLFWSDMLGDQSLVTGLQVQSNGTFTDVGAAIGYSNYRNRWAWGATLQQIPYSFSEFTAGFGTVDSTDAYIEQVRQVRQTIRSASVYTAYPLSRASRAEFNGGYQNITFDDRLETLAQDVATGAILIDETVDLPAPSALNLFVGSVAFVYDFSVYGATTPIVGERYRLELSPVLGSLDYLAVLGDYRRYFLPLRPFTIALRGLHYGRYGGDGESDRLASLFVGYQSLLRGYDSNSFSASECVSPDGVGCPTFEQLFGSRLAIANAELRFPLLGLLRLGGGYYGFLPLETAFFFDAGVAWTSDDEASFLGGDRDIVKSFGIALRLGLSRYLVLELDFVNPLDRPKKDWFWQFSLSPGF